jgi:hypothetical protein
METVDRCRPLEINRRPADNLALTKVPIPLPEGAPPDGEISMMAAAIPPKLLAQFHDEVNSRPGGADVISGIYREDFDRPTDPSQPPGDGAPGPRSPAGRRRFGGVR